MAAEPGASVDGLPAVRIGCVAAGPVGAGGDLLRSVLEGEILRLLPEAEVRWLTPTDALGEVDHVVMIGDALPGMKLGTALTAADVAALVARHVPAPVVEQRAAFLRSVGALDDPPTSTDLDAIASELASRLGATPTGADIVAFARATSDSDADSDAALLAVARAYDPHDGTDAIDATLERIAIDAVRTVARREGLDSETLQARRATAFAAERATIERSRAETARQAVLARETLHEHLAAEIDQLRAQLEGETARREHVEAELEAVYSTRTFRATARLRDAYGRVRGSDSST